MISSWKVGCVQERIDYRGVFLQGDRKELAVPIRRRRIESNTPLQMFVMMLAGWVNEQQRAVHAYLKEENRVLRELHGHKRLSFSDDQRKRLAAKGHALGRRVLREFEPIVTPDTILRWHRELIARKYDGSAMLSENCRSRGIWSRGQRYGGF
jgi:hypothetical protein